MESNVAQLPVSHRLWAWFETNKKPAIAVTAVIIVAGLIIWFVSYQHDEKQIAAGHALSDVAAGQIGATAHPDAANAFLSVASSYPNSSAGARALLLAAGTLFTQGKYAEAQAQFEKFTREYHDSPYMGEALLGVAASLDAQNKTDAAATAYKDLIDHHPNELVVPQAKFSLARIYEAQNKPELARDLYQDVERAMPFTSLGNEAGMRLEELTAKYPKLAPPGPAPVPLTNAPMSLQKK